MSFNLKAVAATLTALFASGAANAINGTTLQDFASGDSSLLFFAVDKTSPGIASVGVDLGYNLSSFLTTASTAGTSIVWNFGTDTLSVNGAAADATGINWASLDAFFSTPNVTAGQTQWGVIAGDSKSNATSDTPIRYMSTSAAASVDALTVTQTNIIGMSAANALFGGLNSDADGVTTSTSSLAYVARNGSGLGGNLNWQNNGVAAAAAVGTDLNFFMFSLPEGVVTKEQFAGVWSFDGEKLSYTVAAIPEPETYAMLLAGLGLLGVAARRRAA